MVIPRSVKRIKRAAFVALLHQHHLPPFCGFGFPFLLSVALVFFFSFLFVRNFFPFPQNFLAASPSPTPSEFSEATLSSLQSLQLGEGLEEIEDCTWSRFFLGRFFFGSFFVFFVFFSLALVRLFFDLLFFPLWFGGFGGLGRLLGSFEAWLVPTSSQFL